MSGLEKFRHGRARSPEARKSRGGSRRLGGSPDAPLEVPQPEAPEGSPGKFLTGAFGWPRGSRGLAGGSPEAPWEINLLVFGNACGKIMSGSRVRSGAPEYAPGYVLELRVRS